MRDRANEIHKLQHQLTEKDEAIQVLNNQLELMRKQLMHATSKNGISNGTSRTDIDDRRESRETQTMQMTTDTRSNSPGSRRSRKQGACCVISWAVSECIMLFVFWACVSFVYNMFIYCRYSLFFYSLKSYQHTMNNAQFDCTELYSFMTELFCWFYNVKATHEY